ncbi:MAG: hypothetical protein ACYC7L_01710 [Nitrospirota bacterium]
MQDVQEMIGKEVMVTSNGMRYRGVLIEVSDVEVHIRSQLQYVSLPAATVTDVVLADGTNKQWTDTFAGASDKKEATFAVPDEKEAPTFAITNEEEKKKGLIP